MCLESLKSDLIFEAFHNVLAFYALLQKMKILRKPGNGHTFLIKLQFKVD